MPKVVIKVKDPEIAERVRRVAEAEVRESCTGWALQRRRAAAAGRWCWRATLATLAALGALLALGAWWGAQGRG